jgi:hypothetical protein
MRIRSAVVVLGALAIPLCVAPRSATSQQTLSIQVLSSRPEMVSGGDALIEIRGGVPFAYGLQVTAGGRDVSGTFALDSLSGSWIGLVEGLETGANTIEARSASSVASLVLTNHPLAGPIVSGPHHTPLICRTVESGLGEPLDADCSAATRVDYFYRSIAVPHEDGSTPGQAEPGRAPEGAFRPFPLDAQRPADIATTRTIDGREVPYIVRVESGTINRSIYRIAILDDPAEQDPATSWRPGAGWNGRLVYSFGGGCGTNYNQGTNQVTGALDHEALSRGFAFAISSQNVMGHRCNDALSGEAMMMVKEHFIERYGLPTWTMGRGGSGGAIQQLLIAQNYPGLLDGIVPSLSFSDSFSLRVGVSDCRLLVNYFTAHPTLSEEQQNAISGHTGGTCAAWDRGLVNVIVADHAPGCGIPAELVYHAETNPRGARCTLWDTNVASFGTDPATGHARRSLDNVGVQYGLAALNSGAISREDFLQLNERIGGFTNDGHPHPRRTVADPEAVRLAFQTGRVNTAGGSLSSIPILHHRTYTDAIGDIHDRFRDFTVRERLRQAHGRTDNQVIWIYSGASAARVSALAMETMTTWLDALDRDRSDDPAIERVARARPADATDACWDAEGNRIEEIASFDGGGRCNQLYPVHRNARMVAGAPLTDDVLKCHLKAVDAADYSVRFTDAEVRRLNEIFPEGVCDYSRPSQHRVPLAGTYLKLPLPGATF